MRFRPIRQKPVRQMLMGQRPIGHMPHWTWDHSVGLPEIKNPCPTGRTSAVSDTPVSSSFGNRGFGLKVEGLGLRCKGLGMRD